MRGWGVLMCETVCRTPNNTVQNQLISLLLVRCKRLLASWLFSLNAKTLRRSSLRSSVATSHFCTIARNRGIPAFSQLSSRQVVRTTLLASRLGSLVTLGLLNCPRMTQERSLWTAHTDLVVTSLESACSMRAQRAEFDDPRLKREQIRLIFARDWFQRSRQRARPARDLL